MKKIEKTISQPGASGKIQGRPPRIHWGLLREMLFLVDPPRAPVFNGISEEQIREHNRVNPDHPLKIGPIFEEIDVLEAARRIVATPAARRLLGDDAQTESLVRTLTRQWEKYEKEIREQARELAKKDLYIEVVAWQMIREHPEYPVDADTLQVILGRRDLINDPLLHAISELIERGKATDKNS